MKRLFWPIYLAVSLAWSTVISCSFFGPSIELSLFPIRGNQTVAVIERTPTRLCWLWSSDKLRPAVSDNIDVFLVTPDGDRSVMAPFVRDSGQPWHVRGARPPGPRASELCILLPPHVTRADDLHVESTIYYRGWHELWVIKVPVPDVVSPGDAS